MAAASPIKAHYNPKVDLSVAGVVSFYKSPN